VTAWGGWRLWTDMIIDANNTVIAFRTDVQYDIPNSVLLFLKRSIIVLLFLCFLLVLWDLFFVLFYSTGCDAFLRMAMPRF